VSITDLYHSICKTKINKLLVFHFQVNLILWETEYLPTKMKTVRHRNITGLPTAITRQISLYNIFHVTSIETISNQPLLLIKLLFIYLDYCQEKNCANHFRAEHPTPVKRKLRSANDEQTYSTGEKFHTAVPTLQIRNWYTFGEV